MGEYRKPKVGDVVIFVDPRAVDRNALVTAVWSETCINVVFVTIDEAMIDTYGRQIARSTSVSHVDPNSAHGNYWRWPGEDKKPVQPPLET
jgi:hypothetical protein